MDSLRTIITRDLSSDIQSSDNVVNLLIAVLSLVFFGLVLAAFLYLLQRYRRRKQMRLNTLPQYREVKHSGNHRRLTVQTSTTNDRSRSSIIIINSHGQPMLANPQSPPHSPDNVPEIHITFPDEHDDRGRRQSGRVVLVRVGDNAAVGLEPVYHEQLPAYEMESHSEFHAIDMEKIGGLKEKEYF